MIYAIHAVGTQFVKFGRAGNPIQRLAGLQTAVPYDLKMIACASWPDEEEPLIHIHLSESHVRGEWFKRDQTVEKIIGLLRDGQNGLSEWQRISRAGNNRPLAMRRLARAA